VDKNWSLDPKPVKAPVPAPEPVSVKEEQANKEFEEAAVASAAHIFAENAEKARLEEEQRKLEEERLKQQTAAAAKIMEEELANKKLREAREAEKKQREEQERQVMEMLKGLGAKQRFKAAMANGKMDVARVAAAVMVQGAYRSKLARRRMMIKKAEKERLLQEGVRQEDPVPLPSSSRSQAHGEDQGREARHQEEVIRHEDPGESPHLFLNPFV
jgi:transcriptional regulator of heat shock response